MTDEENYWFRLAKKREAELRILITQLEAIRAIQVKSAEGVPGDSSPESSEGVCSQDSEGGQAPRARKEADGKEDCEKDEPPVIEPARIRELMALMREFGATRLTLADQLSIDMIPNSTCPGPEWDIGDRKPAQDKREPQADTAPTPQPSPVEVTMDAKGNPVAIIDPDLFG